MKKTLYYFSRRSITTRNCVTGILGGVWDTIGTVQADGVTFVTVEKLGSQRAQRDLADLQVHQTGETGEPRKGENAPAQVSTRHILVSDSRDEQSPLAGVAVIVQP